MKHVPSYGPSNARIMVVGEAPGEYEEREGRPFVGPAGKMLRNFLLRAGIDPESVFYTNICKYRPPENKLEKFFYAGGVPSEPIILGLAELEQEIERVHPNIIYAAGNYALWALTGKTEWNERASESRARGFSGIYKWRGSILPCVLREGFKVLPSFHPSFINREGYSEHGTWAADLAKLRAQSEFPEIQYPKRNVTIDPSGKQRSEFQRSVFDAASKAESILTFDIEYIGNRLLCVGMTLDRDNPVVVPTRNQSDINYCRDILTCGIGLNAQNSMFDCSVLEWWYQMPVMRRIKYDTMLAAHAANIELPKGLDYLASIYTDQPYWKDMVSWKQIKKGQQSIDTVYHYNAIDTAVEHEVMEEQIRWDLTDPSVRRVFEFEMAMLNPLWEVSRRGILVDIDAIKTLEKTLQDEQAAYQAILNITAQRHINVMSGKDLGWFLHSNLGMKPVKVNKTGPATDDKTLATLQLRNPEHAYIIQLIRDIKNRRSLQSKFTDIELDDDGRLRGMYNPAGTDTGRLASKKFYPTGRGAQQQNQPRDKRVRRVFLPDRGRKFGYADLERAESLVVAHITQDREMLRVHAPTIDAHKELAVQLFNVDLSGVSDDQRYLAKKTRHAGNYMQGPQRFMAEVNKEAAKTGVSIDFTEAKHFIMTYRGLHPGLGGWWHETELQLLDNRTLVNLLGRRRVFYGCRPDGQGGISDLPNAVAFVPQSTVGDTLNVGLLQLSGTECHYGRQRGIVGRIREWYPLLQEGGFEILQQIHDAVGFHYYEKYEEQVMAAIRELMRVPLTVPKTGEDFEIPVEIQVGPSWGDCKVWQPQEKAA